MRLQPTHKPFRNAGPEDRAVRLAVAVAGIAGIGVLVGVFFWITGVSLRTAIVAAVVALVAGILSKALDRIRHPHGKV